MPGERRLRDLASTGVTGDAAKAFWRAATQRRGTAAYLLNSESNDKYLDAVYLAGYAAECALKSLILRRTPKSERGAVLDELTSGARAHNFDVLSRLLRIKGCPPPQDIREHLISLSEEWRTDLRYIGAMISRKEAERFLKRVDAICEWARRSW
jgi:HEPN domain-containing protein